jgi:RND family efflux transporter MFP subunit
MEFADQVRLVGRTQAWTESRIVAEVAGRVQTIHANEGVRVSRGEPLVAIDHERIGLDLVAKGAQARQAELQAALAETQLERTQELRGRNLVSQTTLDSAMAWAAIQSARFEELGAERGRLQLDFDRCTIRAPFTGFTGRRLIDVGEWVAVGTPVFEMVDLSRIRITVDLPERYFGHLSQGSSAQVTRATEPDVIYQGTVTGVAASASAETHTFPVTVTVSDGGDRLGGGMLVRVTLSLKERFESLAVPKDAVVRQGTQTMVYTVVEGKAVPIPVLTSSEEGSLVAVQSEALAEGMPVVVRGNERIFPGAPVMVAGAPPPGAAESSGTAATTEAP